MICPAEELTFLQSFSSWHQYLIHSANPHSALEAVGAADAAPAALEVVESFAVAGLDAAVLVPVPALVVVAAAAELALVAELALAAGPDAVPLGTGFAAGFEIGFDM